MKGSPMELSSSSSSRNVRSSRNPSSQSAKPTNLRPQTDSSTSYPTPGTTTRNESVVETQRTLRTEQNLLLRQPRTVPSESHRPDEPTTPQAQVLDFPEKCKHRLSASSSSGIETPSTIKSDHITPWTASDDELLLSKYQTQTNNPLDAPFTGLVPPSEFAHRVAKQASQTFKTRGIPFKHSVSACRKRLLKLCTQQQRQDKIRKQIHNELRSNSSLFEAKRRLMEVTSMVDEPEGRSLKRRRQNENDLEGREEIFSRPKLFCDELHSPIAFTRNDSRDFGDYLWSESHSARRTTQDANTVPRLLNTALRYPPFPWVSPVLFEDLPNISETIQSSSSSSLSSSAIISSSMLQMSMLTQSYTNSETPRS